MPTDRRKAITNWRRWNPTTPESVTDLSLSDHMRQNADPGSRSQLHDEFTKLETRTD
jgi:hypothetical protein